MEERFDEDYLTQKYGYDSGSMSLLFSNFQKMEKKFQEIFVLFFLFLFSSCDGCT